MHANRKFALLLALAASLATTGLSGCAAPAAPLHVVTALTPPNSFTPGIEGPAVDAAGNIYAVNFARKHTIGRVTPQGEAEVFLTLPGNAIANGIRFGRDGSMFVADYIGHTVWRIDPATRALTVHAHEAGMTQPNDLAIGADGTLYASDPDWKNNTGRVWHVAPDGKVTLAADAMGTANGIELSPDGRLLYVGESVQRVIWVFDVGPGGALSGKRRFASFPDFGMDGMRVDVDGNL